MPKGQGQGQGPTPPPSMGGGGGKINLGVPTGAGPGPGSLAGPPAMPPPAAGGGGEGGQGPETPSSANMDYPELHIDGLPDEAGLDGLPDEGHARIHYKVTAKGKRTYKAGPLKGKPRAHATLEVHHITPEGGGEKKSEADTIRDKAQKYFQMQDQGGGAPPGGPDQGPTSEMPG